MTSIGESITFDAMLYSFALILAWTITAWGWGSILVLLRKAMGVQDPYRLDVVEPVVGLVILTGFTNLFNFFQPIQSDHAVWLMLIGGALFLWRLSRRLSLLSQPLFLVLSAAWIFVISTQAVLQAFNYDSGLYHIPAIKWLIDSKTPFGLANLHGRFGFNSSWFSTSALFTQIVSLHAANYTALASETLYAIFGIAVIYALAKFLTTSKIDFATLFLMLSGVLGFSNLVNTNLSSPSTDHPAVILTLLLVYVALRALQTAESPRLLYETLLLTVISLFIITIKVSMLPLVLFPLWFLYKCLRQHQINVRFLILMAGASVFVIAPWLVRGVMLSGCLLYPVYATCIPQFAWTVTQAQADDESLYIRSWARVPHRSPQVVLASWDWLSPWSARLFSTPDFIYAFLCLGLGLVLIAVTWRKRRDLARFREILVLVGFLLIGLLYWFITAPDLRFGASWLWAIGIISLSIGIWNLLKYSRLLQPLRLAAIALVVCAAWSVSVVGTSYVQRAGWDYHVAWWFVPPIPKPNEVVVEKTKQGVSINVVPESRCYWEKILCTPYFKPNLILNRTLDYRLQMIMGKE